MLRSLTRRHSRRLTSAAAFLGAVLLVACGEGEENALDTGPSTVLGSTPDSASSTETVAGAPSTAPSTATPSSTSSVPPSTSTPPSSVPYPAERNTNRFTDDPVYESVEQLAADSTLIVAAEVSEVSSLGRPSLEEDPYADEYVAVSMRVTETFKGETPEHLRLGWSAINVNPDGQRVAVWVASGLPPPSVGNQMLLFLDEVDPAYDEFLGGIPTHEPVALDGIVYLENNVPVVVEQRSPAGEELLTMTLDSLQGLISN